jgi:hypothetical protein
MIKTVNFIRSHKKIKKIRKIRNTIRQKINKELFHSLILEEQNYKIEKVKNLEFKKRKLFF